MSTKSVSVTTHLFGTLEVEGGDSYYCFATQSNTVSTWYLSTKDVFETQENSGKPKGNDAIVAALKISNTGKVVGTGKTYILSRMLEALTSIVGKAASSHDTTSMFLQELSYDDSVTGDYLSCKLFVGGRNYYEIVMKYEGFTLSVSRYNKKPPFKAIKMFTVETEKFKAVMVAGLGVRTFALLKKQMGSSLDWYNTKRYVLVDTVEKFRQMMLDYLECVQAAANNNTTVLTCIDTETTGLSVVDLSPDNPQRDHIVAIPFGWKKDEAYVICTDMYYFSNVDEEEIYQLFQLLFSRNKDYTAQDIQLNYCGKSFSFSRKNITTVGVNVGFDTRAFKCSNCDIYFDEDVSIMHYNLATDYSQGRNALKWMTHHYIGDETLELEDLFGPQHKDKYRYLSDPELALVYGGADADYPRILWFKFRRLTDDRLYNLYKKYDMTAVYRTALATYYGMPVDERAVKSEGELVIQDMETLKNFIYKYAYAAYKGALQNRSDELCDMLGLSSKEEIAEIGESEQMYRYKFTPANHKKLLFNILGYPIIKMSAKSQTPALDKFVLKKLAEKKRDTPVEFLKQSIPSVSDTSEPLIDKNDFNEMAYPLADIFLKYSKLWKEYSAYYKPIMTHDMESKMFYTFSLQRAATRRILSPGQTMKGSLKRLAIAPPGKLYLCFDASQIEYRLMASLAYIQTAEILRVAYPDDWEERLYNTNIARIHRMMQNEEADYHIETASMMTGLKQYMIDYKTRKMYKNVGFGLPYGLGDAAMCELLFGKNTPENMKKTLQVVEDYEKQQSEIIRLLESTRDNAFVPANISDEFREMLGIGDTPVGIVRNFTGFYRLFILEKITRAKKARIRRQAGNCKVQGGAAELFRRMIYNFYQGCVQADIDEAVRWVMLVHDEVDCIIDDSLDICKVIDVVYTNCTLRYKDHIPYFVGIGFGHNWAEAKDDSAELPVIMVRRLLDAYHAGKFSIPSDGNQPANLLKLKRHYMCDRIYEEIKEIIPSLDSNYEWNDEDVQTVNDKFNNYIVRAYLSVFLTKEEHEKYPKGAPLHLELQRWLEARKQYGFGVDFLQTKFVDAKDALENLDLMGEDSAESTFVLDSLDSVDLSVSILENEDVQEKVEGGNDWFDETALFDYDVPSEDIVVEDDGSYDYLMEKEDEDDLIINKNPTNAFDIFITNKYVRKYVMTTADNIYSISLGNTTFAGKASVIASTIKTEFGAGEDTVILIDKNIKKVTNVKCTTENLDALDKLLCGVLK